MGWLERFLPDLPDLENAKSGARKPAPLLAAPDTPDTPDQKTGDCKFQGTPAPENRRIEVTPSWACPDRCPECGCVVFRLRADGAIYCSACADARWESRTRLARAAFRAGYSERTAASIGVQLLNKTQVAESIQKAQLLRKTEVAEAIQKEHLLGKTCVAEDNQKSQTQRRSACWGGIMKIIVDTREQSWNRKQKNSQDGFRLPSLPSPSLARQRSFL